MNTTKLGQAAWNEWAAYGFYVFPCSRTKRPCTPHGFKDAVVEEDDVYNLFAQYSDAEYIGVATGHDGLFVIDFDIYKGADAEAFIEELKRDDLLTATRVHRTRSGGLHYFYYTPDGFNPLKSSVPANGVEVKGVGGYVIVPPSPDYYVEYAEPISISPIALYDVLTRRQRHFSTLKDDELEKAIIEGSNFHESLNLLAARRQSRGETTEATMEHLRALMRASVASQPEHPRHSRWGGLMSDEGKEFSRIVYSGYQKFNPIRKSERFKQAIADKSAAHKISEQVDESDFFNKSYLASEVFDEQENKKFILHPLIMESDVVLLSADPKAGKTIWALCVALAMASGTNFGNLVPTKDSGKTAKLPVVYFALEGQSAVKERVQAWFKQQGVWHENVPLLVVEEPLDFTSIVTRNYVAEELAKANKFFNERGFGDISMVVIDTLTKAMPGKDQNKVEDTSAVFDIVRQIRQANLNSALLYLHHNKKEGASPRGSSNILAEPDTILQLEQSKEEEQIEGESAPRRIVNLSIYMARAIDDTFREDYYLKPVSLGTNSQGIERQSAIMVALEKDTSRQPVAEALIAQRHKNAVYKFKLWLEEQMKGLDHIKLKTLDDALSQEVDTLLSQYYIATKNEKKSLRDRWNKFLSEGDIAEYKTNDDFQLVRVPPETSATSPARH